MFLTRWLGTRHMCRDVSRLLSRAQDERLPWLARAQVRAHLALCEGCDRFARQLDLLREATRRYRS